MCTTVVEPDDNAFSCCSRKTKRFMMRKLTVEATSAERTFATFSPAKTESVVWAMRKLAAPHKTALPRHTFSSAWRANQSFCRLPGLPLFRNDQRVFHT